jgi:uncharacterized repeat protein (TIGR01451 family)
LLQDTLSNTSPNWSRPNLLNNIFADNRAGWAELPTALNYNDSSIHGIGDPIDSVTTVQRWDIGVASAAGLCDSYNHDTDTCNSPIGVTTFTGANNTTNALASGGLTNADPAAVSYLGTDNLAANTDGADTLFFANAQDFQVDSLTWRSNVNNSFPILVAHYVPISLLADYHLTNASPLTTARNGGAASGGGTAVPLPAHDIDGESRPLLGGYDRGADEFPGAQANLSITKTDGVTSVSQGGAVSYTIVVSNAGPSVVVGAPVTDTVPASLTGASWTCAGAGCTSAGAAGNISTTVNLGVGASVTFTLSATVSNTAAGSITNTASVAAPAGVSDPSNANNSASDTDTVILPLPTLGVLDNFNRANSSGLGANWGLAFASNIGVNSNQALSAGGLFGIPATGFWNPTSFAAKQGVAYTFANTTNNADALILKASGGPTLGVYTNFIRVQYSSSSSQVVVATTTSGGLGYSSPLATFTGVTFTTGDTITAVANADGSVDVWKNSTYLGRSNTSSFTGGGRLGVQLANGSRVDNFAGGTVL